MSGEVLKIDSAVLQTATTAFDETVDTLNRIQAEATVGEAAAAVAQLLTAESCRKAQAGISAAIAVAVETLRVYGENLDAVTRAYSGKDQASAADIADVDIAT